MVSAWIAAFLHAEFLRPAIDVRFLRCDRRAEDRLLLEMGNCLLCPKWIRRVPWGLGDETATHARVDSYIR